MISSKRDSCSQLVAGNYDVIVDDDLDLSTTTATSNNSTGNNINDDDDNNLNHNNNSKDNDDNNNNNNSSIKTILSNFLERYDQHESDLVNNPSESAYINEFKLLKEFSKSLKEDKANLIDGELDCNTRKNRYKDIIPFNHTRVVLNNCDPSIKGSEYINANYIKGPSGQKKTYIACQGPLACTLNDFWQMIWECNVSIIVMACNENESGKPKCELYWPEKVATSESYGNIQVNLVRVRQICHDFLIRKFSIKLLEPINSDDNNFDCSNENELNQNKSKITLDNNNIIAQHNLLTTNTDNHDVNLLNKQDINDDNNVINEQKTNRKILCERTICQFHYTTWPDHGAPDSIHSILEMVRLIRDIQPNEDKPILIHCSAGCGRTGTICCIDYVWGLLRSNKLEPNFDLCNIISEMRQQRMAMVQTLEQYILCHRAVAALFMNHLKNYIEPTEEEEEDLLDLTTCINDNDNCFIDLDTNLNSNNSMNDEHDMGPVII